LDISEVVGGIDKDSTASFPLAVLPPPMLATRLGVLCIGLGLALLLAARVAAIKLGLFTSIPACRWPLEPLIPPPPPEPNLGLAPWLSTSIAAFPPAACGPDRFEGLAERLAADDEAVAAVRAPLSFFRMGVVGDGDFF
jgi:hypothetical protein